MYPEKGDTIKIKWDHNTWVPCLVMSNLDKLGYIKLQYGKKKLITLLFKPRKNAKQSPITWMKYRKNKDYSTMPKPIWDHSGFNLAMELVNLFISNMNKHMQCCDKFDVKTIINTFDNFGSVRNNSKITSNSNSYVLAIFRTSSLYNLLNSMYLSVVGTLPISTKKYFFTNPTIYLTISDNKVKGISHVDKYNIPDSMNMVWCGYFDTIGYIHKPYEFLNLDGDILHTTKFPCVFDAKNIQHNIIFDKMAPDTSVRISVLFFHNCRRSKNKQIIR